MKQKTFGYPVKLLVLTLVSLLILPCFAQAALATAPSTASCEVSYLVDNKPITEARINLYHVADLDETGQPQWNDTFREYHLTMALSDHAKASDLAKTLSALVTKDSIRATTFAKTDDEGKANFSDLKFGVYLVDGPMYTSGRYEYRIVPSLIVLPHLNSNGQFEYSASIELKHNSRYNPPDTPPSTSTIYRKVLKVWEGDNKGTRPHSIQVELLRDGRVWDTVTLNEKNDWRHSWNDLSSRYDWTVVEKDVPDGYSASVRREKTTFVITNTAEPDTPVVPVDPVQPVNPPINPQQPTPPSIQEPPVNPSNPTNPTPSSSNTQQTHTGTKLPQTGQLQWPIPVCVCAGMTLLISGLWLRKREDDWA